MFGSLFKSKPKIRPTSIASWETFESHVLKSDLPVIVDVWSPGCGPCNKLAPILVDIATRYDGRIKVVDVNVGGAESALVRSLRVQATPTIIVYRDGKEMGRERGFLPASWFDQMIKAEFPA